MNDKPKAGSQEEMRHFINIYEKQLHGDKKDESAVEKSIGISWGNDRWATFLAIITAFGIFLSGLAATATTIYTILCGK